MLDWQKNTKLRIFIKTICIVLMISFLSYDLAWAGATDVLSRKSRSISNDSSLIEIPQELGVIKDSYTSKYNPRKVVIHIQDAHANIEAQGNEAKLIKHLKDKYKINLVSVEGGFGDFDTDFFRSFPKDKKVRDKIADYFFSKAFISGTDYLLITENNPPKVFGAEDKELYASHLDIFKSNQEHSESILRSLSSAEAVLKTLKEKYFSKDLKELDYKVNDFKSGRISLEEYISYLYIASIVNNVDLTKFPNLYVLITTQELERKINFQKAEDERQDLIDALAKSLSKQDLEDLVKVSLDFKGNKLTPAEYYAYLEKLTLKSNIQDSSYNNLFTYIKYISLSERLDNSMIFGEIDDFAQLLKDKLAVTQAQRDIDSLGSIISILKGLSNINLAPKDYEYFKNNRKDFNAKALAKALRRYTSSTALDSLPTDEEISSLDKFYELAFERDKAMVSNSLGKLKNEYSSDSIILVAGGFHTAGITSILKEKDISYIVIAPNIKAKQDKENTYFAFLKDKKLPLSNILNDPDTLQIINSISDPQARMVLVGYWVARASRYYPVKELQAQLNRLELSSEDRNAIKLALDELSPKETRLAKEGLSGLDKTVEKPKPEQNDIKGITTVQNKGLFRKLSEFIATLKLKQKPKQTVVPKSSSPTETEIELLTKDATAEKPAQKEITLTAKKSAPQFNFTVFLKDSFERSRSAIKQVLVNLRKGFIAFILACVFFFPEVRLFGQDYPYPAPFNTPQFTRQYIFSLSNLYRKPNQISLYQEEDGGETIKFTTLEMPKKEFKLKEVREELNKVVDSWLKNVKSFPEELKQIIRMHNSTEKTVTFNELMSWTKDELSKTSDLKQKARIETVIADFLYDFISRNVSYDQEYLKQYKDWKAGKNDGPVGQSLAAPFAKSKAVCGTYSRLFQAFAEGFGLDAGYAEVAMDFDGNIVYPDHAAVILRFSDNKVQILDLAYKARNIAHIVIKAQVKDKDKWVEQFVLNRGDLGPAENIRGLSIAKADSEIDNREAVFKEGKSIKAKHNVRDVFLGIGIALGMMVSIFSVVSLVIAHKQIKDFLKQIKLSSLSDITNKTSDLVKEGFKFLTAKTKQAVVALRPSLIKLMPLAFILFFSSPASAKENSGISNSVSSFGDIFTRPVVILTLGAVSAGYIIYRFAKRLTANNANSNVNIILPDSVLQAAEDRGTIIQRPAQIIRNSLRISSSPVRRLNSEMPYESRQEIVRRVQGLGNSVAQSSKNALAASFRPTGPYELPLPMPLSMLSQGISDRDKIIRILENMQRMMDGTDEKVLRDFERAIDNARDKVTEEALSEFDELTNEQIYALLTSGYLEQLKREFQRIIKNQIQHMVRFHAPTQGEQSLYVSDEINERYSRLPRYLKWLLSNNPELEQDPFVREWLDTVQLRMSRIPAFPEMITEYSKAALNKSLYLNPELAMRMIAYLSGSAFQERNFDQEELKRQIESELARNLPEDMTVPVTDIIDEESLPEPPQNIQPLSLPASRADRTESLRSRLKAVADNYRRFMVKFNEQEAQIKKTEADLEELSLGLEEAKRQNDRVIIEALRPAVEGLRSKLTRMREGLIRLNPEKAILEEQIRQMQRDLGEDGDVTLYSITSFSWLAIGVSLLLLGVPVYFTKRIINKRYNTIPGKILGWSASINTLIAGYYTYLVYAPPQIEKAVESDYAQWLPWTILCSFFLIWPVSIISGALAGKTGKGLSHKRLYWKAKSEFKKGNIDEAINLINQAIRLNQKNAVDYSLLAECQLKQGHTDQAIASYKKALEIEPNNSRIHNDLGIALDQRGYNVKAIESYRRSLELKASDPVVLANLGRSLHRKGELLEAAKTLQHAQEIKPDTSVTEELNQILQATGKIEKPSIPARLGYFTTLRESVPSRIKWTKDAYNDFSDWGGGAIVGGLLAAGGFLYGAYQYHWWQLGTEQVTTLAKWVAWLSSGLSGVLLGAGFPLIVGKLIDAFKTLWRFARFPLDYARLGTVNKKPSDELSDSEIERTAPIFARMSREYLEKIFRSWMEAGQEEKIARLFRFGEWEYDKRNVYGDIGEYKRVSRIAAVKFAGNVQEQKVIFDGIDREKEKLAQKGVNNAISLMKDILLQVTEHSRNRDEFLYWFAKITDLPKNILDKGSREVLTVFTDLREFALSQEESSNKFGGSNQEQTAKVRQAINGLVQKLEREGLNYAGILKKALSEINHAARNQDEFLFWTNEVMQFDKQLWSSGRYLGLLKDLIAYVRAKETASRKLCHTPEEISRLFQTVDNLRDELKRQGVPGDNNVLILKDVVPRITDASRSLEEFLGYIALLRTFGSHVWRSTQAVLEVFNNHTSYKQTKESASAKFSLNSEEQKRLSSVWEALDNNVNFTRTNSVNLLKNTLDKIANFAGDFKEFIFWIGTLSELDGEVLEVFCRDFDAVLTYYREKGKSRDFNHLPKVLNQYHKTYHQTVLITPNLLDSLTDPSLEPNKRIEKVSEYLIEQKIVKLGGSPNLVGLRDAVSFEELIRVAGEDTIRSFIRDYSPVRKAMEKMGSDGIYTYAESHKPAYYKHFLEEARGLRSGFNQPGEKFRVACKGEIVKWSKEEEAQVMPVSDTVMALRQLIQHLRMEWPNLYDNFIEPKRELIKGRHLEEFITHDTAAKMSQQLLGKLQNWQQFSEQQRAVFTLKIMEIYSFPETADLRSRINSAGDDFNKLGIIIQYWQRIQELILKNKWMEKKSKFYSQVSKLIDQKIATINNKLNEKGKQILQFHLSGGTLADFFKGWVSIDCTRNTDGDYAHFLDTQAFVMDPACFLFKVIEENKWVGNIYTFAFKDKDGKFYLFLDMFQINDSHDLVKNGEGEEEVRREFAKRFIRDFMSYLGSQGFDYLLISHDPAQRGIKDALRKVAREKSGKNDVVAYKLKKLGGTEFFSEAGVNEEFVQTINGNLIMNDFQDVAGYRIELDKATPEALQQKQTDLDYLEKLLGEMTAQETHLLALSKEKQQELTQINQKGVEAANSGKETLAATLMSASEQKKTERQKIEYELNELRTKIREERQRLDEFRASLGISGINKGAGLTGKALSLIPFAGLVNLLSLQPAQAQGIFSFDNGSNPFTPFLIVSAITGFAGLVYYVLYKVFAGKPKYEPYRGPVAQVPLYEEYKLPRDINELLTAVLSRVSSNLQDLIPAKIDIHLPFDIGIRKDQAARALRLLFSTLIKNESVFDFFKFQPFYENFKQRAKELGLADNFDQPQHEYSFNLAKEEILQEENRRAQEFIENFIAKLAKDYSGLSKNTLLSGIVKKRTNIRRADITRINKIDFYNYYLLLKGYAYFEFKKKIDTVLALSEEHKYLEALSILEEFLRVGIGAELIALEPDASLRDELNLILNRELEDVRWQFNRLAASQAKKEALNQETRDINYRVVLSSRNADDILRGVASGDCTAINGSAFYNTIPQFLFDPGFLDFKVLQDDKWVGNVYTIVAERDNNPVLIIDALQLPVWGRAWPVSVRKLADKVLEKIVEYAGEQGFSQVLMSSFVSNFNAIHDHFNAQYPALPTEIEKVSGFEHLKTLSLWDDYASRNEYLETFSPQWNYGLRGINPNNPHQTLLLRTIWQRNIPLETVEGHEIKTPSQDEVGNSNSISSSTEQTRAKQKVANKGFIKGLFQSLQQRLKKAIITGMILITLAMPNMAQARKFADVPNNQPVPVQVTTMNKPFLETNMITETAFSRGTRHIVAPYIKHPVVGAIIKLSDGTQIVYGTEWDLRRFIRDLGFTPVSGTEKREDIGTLGLAPRRVISMNAQTPEGLKTFTYESALELAKKLQGKGNVSYEKVKGPRLNAKDITEINFSRGTRGVVTPYLNHPAVGAIVKLSDGTEIVYGTQFDLRRFVEDLGFKAVAGSEEYEDIGTLGVLPKRVISIEAETPRGIKRLTYETAFQEARNLQSESKPEASAQPITAPQPETKPVVPEPKSAVPETKPAEVSPEQGKITAAQEDLRRAEEEKAQAQQQLKKMQEQRESERKELESLQGQKEEFNRQIAELKQQLKDLQTELEKAKASTQQNSQVEDVQHKALEEETRRLEQKKLEFSREITKLEAQRQEAQNELNRLSNQKTETSRDLASLQKQLQEVQEQVKGLQDEVQKLDSQKKQYEIEVNKLNQQKEELQKSIDQLNQDKGNLQDDLKDLRQKVSDTKNSLEDEKQRAEANWRNIWSSLSNPAKAGIILLFLSGIGAITAGIILIRRWNKFRHLGTEIDRLKKEAEDLEAKLGTMRSQEKDFTKVREDAEKARLESQQEAERLAQTGAKLEADRKALELKEEDLARQQEEIEVQKKGLMDLDKQKQSVREEIQQLESQRDALKESLSLAEQKTQEALLKAKELREQAESEAEVSEEALTQEQLRLKQQLEAKRQERAAQINALDERLKETKVKYDLDMQELSQKKTETDSEVSGLIAERDAVKEQIEAMNKTLARLNQENNVLLQDLQDLDVQQKALRTSVNSLKEEETRLKGEVEALKKTEEIKPKVDALVAKAQAISKEVDSLYLTEKGKTDSVDTFVSFIRQRSRSGEEEAIRRQLKDTLVSMGAKVILECGPQCGGSDVPKNLVVEFPGTGKFSAEPGFIINAHMDTVKHSTPEEMDISDQGFYHKQKGSFGADDKAGLLVQIEALRFLKENYWDKGVDHRKIIFIITADEEAGFKGAKHLAESHPDLFKNVIFSLTSDGHLNYEVPDFDNSFVIVVDNQYAQKMPYNEIIKTVNEIALKKGRKVHLTAAGLGIGDFASFPDTAKAELHIRSPYAQGWNHTKEEVKIRDLIDHIDLWIGLMLKFSCGIDDVNPRNPNLPGLPKAMIFDLDKTLSRTLQPVPLPILERLKKFLKTKVKIAVISAQSLEEIKTYLVKPLQKLIEESGEPKELLSNFYVAPSLGSQLWQFYTDGQFKDVLLDDLVSDGAPFDTKAHHEELLNAVRKAIRGVVNPKDDIPVIGPVLAQTPKVTFIHDRGISFTLNVREEISADKRKELIKMIKNNFSRDWRLDVLVSGGGTIHIVSRGVDKSIAVSAFKNYLPQKINPEDIIIAGDDSSVSGLDSKLFLPGARNYSVGARRNLPPGVIYYDKGGEFGWQRMLHLFNLLESGSAGSAKGRGMFTPDEHIEVNDVISAAQKENRGVVIWGDTPGWQDGHAKHAEDIAWVISSLKRYPAISITGLGKIDLSETLAASNIVLILPRSNSPPGLLVKGKSSYLIAHNGVSMNSIYIDEVIFKQLYTFEIAVLLAHEAIELGVKKLAAKKGIPWTVQLAKEVRRLAEEYEVRIVGSNPNGEGSRFDERIEEILNLNKPKPKEERKVPQESPVYTQRQEKPRPDIRSYRPQSQIKKAEEPNKSFTLDFPEPQDNVINSLRNLFLDGLLNNSSNLPARLGDFPPPMAHEIKQAYDMQRVNRMPIDADLMAALAVFFSRILPNHANNLINYLRTLSIYIIDNTHSTFGATLSGNTFYIQKSCLEDLLGRPVTVDEINRLIRDKDRQILVILFRIIVHEIGSAFYRLSHKANQDLERLFLGLLSKTVIDLPPSTEQELHAINNTVDLGKLPRIDWAGKKVISVDTSLSEIRLVREDTAGLLKEVNSKLINSLYNPNQEVRNNAAEALAKFNAFEALPFLRILLDQEPGNQVVSASIKTLESAYETEQANKLKAMNPDPFAGALFNVGDKGSLVLNKRVVQTINTLCIGYNGLTLEIDVDALIDTSRGIPQLKGIGFKEAIASLYQAQEKKEIPENIHIRLININPRLDRDKIIKILGLTEDLLDKIVVIPEIPHDYLIKSLEPYLVEGSIRIIFEDNVGYWGKKVDVLVRRGREMETLSSLGLIVAALAKEPKFYESLPQDLKEYIVASTDEKGNIALDDDNKIKQIIFKPIEKTKVDTQYLEQLDRANTELEGNV